MKQRVQRLETGQKNLECYAELAQSRINDFQGMERHGGLIVSELNSGASGLGSEALAGDIVLNSWARYFTLTVTFSTQVYNWVPVNLMLGVTLRWTNIPSREE